MEIPSMKQMCPAHALSIIWTVDLAYLLQKFSIKFSYFTVTLGANPTYSAEKFYMDQFSNDLVRVDMLFQNASSGGIDIQCRSISEREISLFILSGKYVAIALVDQYKLSDSWLKDACLSEFVGGDTAYTGHYIVICGYNSDTDEFEIRDPASSRKSRLITSKCLEEARRSFGTDEDLLLISLEKCDDQDCLAV
uniref:Guanylyl cyclase n=1 Tax=Kalanchoe fedtschenkoi TaxID=63787 RepID=A0A7N0ZZI8_KALFE